MDLDTFDAEVRKIYELLHGRDAKDFPALAKCSAYQELFASAQENEPEDFIEFLTLFEVLGWYLTGGESKKARFAGKTMEELPRLVLRELIGGYRGGYFVG